MTDDRPRMRLGPRHRTEVTRDHVGQRVTIRHVVVEEDGREVVTDVVGELRAWDDEGQLTVERRDGRRVHVDATTIVASRLIPHPPPPRRRPREG